MEKKYFKYSNYLIFFFFSLASFVFACYHLGAIKMLKITPIFNFKFLFII